jgi:hypothetical protein
MHSTELFDYKRYIGNFCPAGINKNSSEDEAGNEERDICASKYYFLFHDGDIVAHLTNRVMGA